MPDLDYMVLADGVASRPDGKTDIYGAGWDTIFAAAVPTQHPQMAVAIRILMSQHEAEHEHRLQLIHERGRPGDSACRRHRPTDPERGTGRPASRSGHRVGVRVQPCGVGVPELRPVSLRLAVGR